MALGGFGKSAPDVGHASEWALTGTRCIPLLILL